MQTPILTAEGNLLMAVGFANNNFTPQASAVLLHVAPVCSAATAFPWLWLLLGVLGLMAIGICAVFALHRRKNCVVNAEPTATVESADSTSSDTVNEPLIQRIESLMVKERVFLRGDLKVANVAKKLHTSSRSVSECIKAQRGLTFTQYVNGYRIEHAKQLMRNHPETKISAIALESGFTNETSFFRTFKALVGKTPSEWMESTDNFCIVS